MNTIDILNKHIALCLDIRAKSYHTITLFDALNSIRTGKYRTQIENIRRLYHLGKSAIAGYKSKKKQLPSFIFSGTLFDTRFKFDICGYTSLMIVDIDKLESVDSIKDKLKNAPISSRHGFLRPATDLRHWCISNMTRNTLMPILGYTMSIALFLK